nr:uncharacterized protein LOC109152623 [Ipomoea trifida]
MESHSPIDHPQEPPIVTNPLDQLPTTHQDLEQAWIDLSIHDAPIKFTFMKETMDAIWRPGKGLVVTELAPNRFLFQLFHEVVMNCIIEGVPWAFEQSLCMTSPWVSFLKKLLMAIVNFVGTFIRSDKNNFDALWKSFLRIRVVVDVTKPLVAKMRIKRKDGDGSWISFRYERLPNFCFICG